VKGNVEIDGRGGDVEVTGVTGTATVNGEFSGAVQFANVAQTLRFNSSRTDMTVQKLTGNLNLEIGSLDARGIDGPFEISTRQKDITLEDFKHSVKIAATNGDVRLSTSVVPVQPVQVDVKKGEITLEIPAKSNFQVDATSRHGEVESDFSAPTLTTQKEGETPSVTGSYGKGGPTFRLTTSYGTIHLAQRSPQHAAPATPPLPAAPPRLGKPATPALPAPPAAPAPPAVGKKSTSTHSVRPRRPLVDRAIAPVV
jgi:DUF4097 and DUF4098 domain-containing protein YvlB